MRKLRRLYAAPELPSGNLYLNPNGPGFFSVVIPIARTNLIINPSIETATTGYTAVGGSIAQSSTYSYHGAYSLAVTPTSALTDGVFYGTISLTSGQAYAYSCKFKGAAGRKYTISIATTGGVDLASCTFTATGRWQWVWGYWVETSSTTRRFYVRKSNHDSTAVFYVDGLQVEAINAGELVSTYIDGDQAGLLPNQFPYPYRWNGTPHASTSTRDVTTRAGGYVLNLDRFRFRLLGIVGLGITAVANIATASGTADGSTFQATIANSRQVAIHGRFEADTPEHLDQLRSDLYSMVGPDSATPRQPLTLIYQRFSGDRVVGDFGRVVASYQSGLEQTASALPVEEATITFTQYLPAIYTNESGAALTVQSSVANANGILQRSLSGTWSAMGSGVSGGTGVYAIARGLDGSVYVGGAYTAMGGVANTSRIARWDGSAWNAMGTGAANQNVSDLAVAPDGSIYAVGTFTAMGGVANTKMIARWNGSAWVAVGTGGDAGTTQLLAVAVAPNGDVYVAGTFTSIGGVAAAGIAKWNGSAWSALSTGLTGGSATGVEIVFDAGGNLYVGGAFTTAGGVAVANIAKWDGSAFTALGDGLGVAGTLGVRSMAFDTSGRLYAGGAFTVSGSNTINRIGVWNGAGWQPLGTGTNNDIYGISFAADGMLYVSGTFTSANGIATPDAAARWNGATWISLDADLPGTLLVYTVKTLSNGTTYVGFESNGTATTAGIASTTNTGTARAYPVVTIAGPSSGTARIYQLLNATTGKILYLNLTINAGETVVARTSPAGTTLMSSFRGDITSAILPGSSLDFALAPGANSVSFFTASSTVTARMSWTNGLQSASDLTN